MFVKCIRSATCWEKNIVEMGCWRSAKWAAEDLIHLRSDFDTLG